MKIIPYIILTPFAIVVVIGFFVYVYESITTKWNYNKVLVILSIIAPLYVVACIWAVLE